jgi:general secretion pathway protein H
MTRRASATSGFTLLELLVVLAIVGVVFGTMVLARPSAAGARVNAAARGVVATLRLARADAIARNTETTVSVDPGTGVVAFSRGKWQLPHGAQVTITFAESERTAAAGGTLRFYPDGQSSGGEINLRLEGRPARVTVSWLTGEARIDR